MTLAEDWQHWRERFDQTHKGVVRLFHDRAIWKTIQAMLNSNPSVARGGFGEYWLESCYANSQLIGIRRETGADRDSIGMLRSLNGLASCPRMATRAWYEQQIRDQAQDAHADNLRRLYSGFDRFADTGAAFIDVARVRADIASLEAVIERVNDYTTKMIAHRDAAIARQLVRPLPITWGDVDDALDTVGLMHVRYYWLCHPGQMLGGLTPVVPPEWIRLFETAWMPEGFALPDVMSFDPPGIYGA